MSFISRSTTSKVKQSKIVPGAVRKLRDSRASFGRATSFNNKKRPAALPSCDDKVTEEPSSTSEDHGLISKLISAAVGAIKFSFGVTGVFLVSTSLQF